MPSVLQNCLLGTGRLSDLKILMSVKIGAVKQKKKDNKTFGHFDITLN